MRGLGQGILNLSFIVHRLQAILDIQEALLNMADIMADLWLEDDTPRIMFRVLVHYNYGSAMKGSEADRC